MPNARISEPEFKEVFISTSAQAEMYMARIEESAANMLQWVAEQSGSPLEFLRNIKFKQVGFHPIGGYPLNLIEQVNQTWTYLAALLGTKKLLEFHPEAGGFHLAPGATASLKLDVMSAQPGMVGAETFAAVTPKNNDKLTKDLNKLAGRPEVYRYVFFMSPIYPGTKRLSALERDGIQVWSVDIED